MVSVPDPAWRAAAESAAPLRRRRTLQDTPLILVGNMWPGRIEWARGAMRAFDAPLRNAEDNTIPMCVPGADEAIALIRRHHEGWLRMQTHVQRV